MSDAADRTSAVPPLDPQIERLLVPLDTAPALHSDALRALITAAVSAGSADGSAPFEGVARFLRDLEIASAASGGDGAAHTDSLHTDQVAEQLRGELLPALETLGARAAAVGGPPRHRVRGAPRAGALAGRGGLADRRAGATARIARRAPRARRRTPVSGARARQRAHGGGAREDVPRAQGRERRRAAAAPGRDRRPARPERCGKDHHVLHDRGAHRAARRPHHARRRGHHADADVPARPARHRLPRAGAVDLPQADGRGQHPRDPRDARPLGAPSGRARLETLLDELEHQAPARAARRTSSPAANAGGSRSRARWSRSRSS